jgi:hypothetical protein
MSRDHAAARESEVLADPTAPRDLERLAVVNEVFLTACRLFVLDSRSGEMQESYRRADYADPRRLGDVTGKYVKRAVGYVRVFENGQGDSFGELPEGVSPDDVVVDELDVSSATPLQDRLRGIARSLRIGPWQDAKAEELAEAIDASLEACCPDNGERCLEQISQWAQSDVFDADGPGDMRDMTERVRRLLDHLGQFAQNLQEGLLGDGKTIGGILAIRALMLARAARAQNLNRPAARSPLAPDNEADALIESLLYVTAPGSARTEHVATGLCARMVRQGDGPAAREAAEGLKAEGDALIARALDGDLLTFYASLYPAAAYELAVAHLGQAAAEASVDPDDKRRWEKLAVNAEERAVRVSSSLGFAVLNLDGTWIARHQLLLRQVREAKGEDAARLKARDLIENQLFYPKALMPILLSEALPPGDRSQRP